MLKLLRFIKRVGGRTVDINICNIRTYRHIPSLGSDRQIAQYNRENRKSGRGYGKIVVNDCWFWNYTCIFYPAKVN